MPWIHPSYYSSLAPFRRLFKTGVPILTYHKLGGRPPGTRLKGLYLGAELFTRQIQELGQAGFVTVSLSQATASQTLKRPACILTFDDGFASVTEQALEPLARCRFRAIQFLVADRLGQTNAWEQSQGEVPGPLMTADQVRQWLAAGHSIGSHTLTHPWLTRLPLAEAREEIAASKRRLEDQFGRPVEHFCYPYGDWNPALADLVESAGYRTACTTHFGVNTPQTSVFSLRRITARYPSRNLKAVMQRWLGRWC